MAMAIQFSLFAAENTKITEGKREFSVISVFSVAINIDSRRNPESYFALVGTAVWRGGREA